MSFVTRLTLQSGDHAKLEDVVAGIKADGRRKGVELKGPHARPPTELRVPQFKTAAGGQAFEEWSYTVYKRDVEIVGHQTFARQVAGDRFPPGVHVSVEIEQQRAMGD
ncbi:MAG: uS10/mL48 family ribosomal protein [Halobacteriales archaeon]